MEERVARHCVTQSSAAVNSGRRFEDECLTGFASGVFDTSLDAAGASMVTFSNSQATSSIDGDVLDEGALGLSSITSMGSSSVEIVSLFAS